MPGADTRLLTSGPAPVTGLRRELMASLRLRVLDVPAPPGAGGLQAQTRVAVLFSGGLDCTVLARLCHELMPLDQGVDLINVAFENPRVAANAQKAKGGEALELSDIYEACPDRMTGRKSFAEIRAVCPGRAFRFVAVCPPRLFPPLRLWIPNTCGRSTFLIQSISAIRARSHHSSTPTIPRWTSP